jgi:uncharacterized protein YaiE (UPF0345 family)
VKSLGKKITFEALLPKLAVVLIAVLSLLSTGCATFSSTPNGYHVAGITANPEEMVAVAGENNLRQTQLKNCWEAYRKGEVYACPGTYDGYGYGESNFYYNGLLPQDNLIPWNGDQSGANDTVRDDVARKDAAEAREMALDSIRMNKRVIRQLNRKR